jgi:hypothetical protein
MATKCMKVSQDRSSEVVGDSEPQLRSRKWRGTLYGQLTTDIEFANLWSASLRIKYSFQTDVFFILTLVRIR